MTGSVTPDRLDDIKIAFDAVISRFNVVGESVYYEFEWMAILHVLMWGGRRVIEVVGPSATRKNDFYEWMNNRFPNWRENPYIKRGIKNGGIRFRLLIMGHWKAFYLIQRIHKFVFRS